MPVFRRNLKPVKENRAFTLTELAIVLGVVGIIVAGIWTAAGSVSQSRKAELAMEELTFIISGYQDIYKARGIDTTDWGDVTCTGLSNGYFSQPMIPSGASCACQADGTTPSSCTYPINPWGGGVNVFSLKGNSPQIVDVRFGGLSTTDCVRFASLIFANADIIRQNINDNTPHTLPPLGGDAALTSVQITSMCAGSTNNYIDAGARAR